MRKISTLVVNKDAPSGGFSEGKFRDNPGDDTGSSATAKIVNDLYYAVFAMIKKYLGAVSDAEESDTASDFLDSVKECASIVGPQQHQTNYNYDAGDIVYNSSLQYRATRNIDVGIDGTTFAAQLAAGAWARVDAVLKAQVDLIVDDAPAWTETDQAPSARATAQRISDAALYPFDATDISAGTVLNVARRGPYHGIGVTSEPANKYFWDIDYVAPMTTARSNLSTSVVNGIIYAIGGNTGAFSAANEAYDPVGNSWVTKTAMTTARMELSTSVVNGIIYAIGGWTGADSAANEAYDPVGNSWTTKTPMTTARQALSTSVVNGIIYAIGGVAGTFSAANEAYDPVGNSWTTKTPMTTARGYLSTSVVNGIIYAIGGNTGAVSAVNEAYDPVGNSWTTKTPMTFARFYHSSCVINGKIYVFGGTTTGSDYVSGIEMYDPVLNTWTTVGYMNNPKRTLGPNAAVIQNRAYLIGGKTSTNTYESSAPYMSVVYDWNYLYEKTTDENLRVIATDAMNSWRGSAKRSAYDITTTPVWRDWIYSNTNKLQWYDLTLLNGWTAALAQFAKDDDGIVYININTLSKTSATNVIFAVLPLNYRTSVDSRFTVSTLSSNESRYIYAGASTGNLQISEYSTLTASLYGAFSFNAAQ